MKRRRPGTAESPEEARGSLIRKLFLLYDGHPPFRSALIQLALEHRSALTICGPRSVLGSTGIPMLEVSWATGEPVPGREIRWYPSWHHVRTDVATNEPAVADYVAALEAFTGKWGLARLGVVPPPEPPVLRSDRLPTDRQFPSVHQSNAEQALEQPGVVAVHDWCLFYHAGGRDHASVAFGAGHVITSLPAGVDTEVRLGEFVSHWNPAEEPLTDHEIPIPDRTIGLFDASGRPASLRALYGWRMHQRVTGAKTRLRRAAEGALDRALTPDEVAQLDQQLGRIETEFAKAGHVHPDTAPDEDKHLWWTFLRLAPVGASEQPLGVWQISRAENAEEKTVRNSTDKMRRRLGIDRFPKPPRNTDHGRFRQR